MKARDPPLFFFFVSLFFPLTLFLPLSTSISRHDEPNFGPWTDAHAASTARVEQPLRNRTTKAHASLSLSLFEPLSNSSLQSSAALVCIIFYVSHTHGFSPLSLVRRIRHNVWHPGYPQSCRSNENAHCPRGSASL